MAMKHFSALTNLRVVAEPIPKYSEPDSGERKQFQMSTALDITLAEYDPSSRDAITAHRLADYRQHRFTLVLMPEIHIMMDDMLKGPEVENFELM